MLGIPADSFTMVYQNASTRQIMGWNELWGTPRTKEVAIDIGSVFLFSTTIGEEEALEALLKTLFELEQAGIGRRKAEGFGRICVSDQFHQEVALK
jgi:CRISPR-associated protein Csx10